MMLDFFFFFSIKFAREALFQESATNKEKDLFCAGIGWVALIALTFTLGNYKFGM